MRSKLQHLSRRTIALLAVASLTIVGLVMAAGVYVVWLRSQDPIDDFHFAPGQTTWNALPEREANAVRFAVIGDYGVDTDNEKYVAEMVHSWTPDFIISTGDNNYPDGRAETIDANVGQYYHDYIGNYQGKYGPGATENQFFPILGNHDWHTSGAQPYLDYFTLPGNERYYDFAWGPVHFFALDSSDQDPDGWTSDSVQAQWLKERLAASDSPWNLVYMHVPPYSSGKYGDSAATEWPYQEWGATAVLSGHDHRYERAIVDGFPYFIVGLSGARAYEVGELIEGSEVDYQEMHGAMVVDVTPESIVFRYYSIDNGGSLIDSYTIENSAEVPTT